MFLIEQRGTILILPQDRKATNTTLFLDISDRKPYVDNEEGLLGFAFHPQFKSNGKFYVNYTLHNPRRSVVSEFQVSKDNPNRADVQSERILFELPQPYANHNGGCTMFGPDGFLYISFGDGGSASDPHLNGQSSRQCSRKFCGST
jgi:glucose/arabinose dehydrogenase